jgi:hypothetical protein
MKPKFEVGDRVVIVIPEDTLLLPSGMTGTVVNCRKSIFEGPQGEPLLFVKILFDNNTTGEYFEYRFELIQKTQINA